MPADPQNSWGPLRVWLASVASSLWQTGNRYSYDSTDFLFLPPETTKEKRRRLGKCEACGHPRADGLETSASTCESCGASLPALQVRETATHREEWVTVQMPTPRSRLPSALMFVFGGTAITILIYSLVTLIAELRQVQGVPPGRSTVWPDFLWRLAASGLFLGLAALFWFIGRRTRHPTAVTCRSCGYNLHGLPPTAPCPECGSRMRKLPASTLDT